MVINAFFAAPPVWVVGLIESIRSVGSEGGGYFSATPRGWARNLFVNG